MRKIYVSLTFLLSFFIIVMESHGQSVGTYVFSPSSGTYTALAGATNSTAAGDDGTQGGIPIGFNFNYGGTVYTHIALTTNGFIRLGTSAAITINTGTANYDNSNFGASTNVPLIAGLWDDNNATGGTIRYVTSGSAPNQVFSVEWQNIHLGGGGSTTTPTGTFQINLFETSNAITVVYGTINALTSSTASIGLNDASSFLSVTPGSPATASPSVTNNNITSAANLTSGTTYTFLPPPPCTPGSLGGGTAVGPAGAVCPGASFTLSVTGASFGSGLTYQWEISPDGTSWSNATGASTGQGYTTTVTTNTYFRRKMTCSGTDVWSTSVLVSVSPPVSTFPYLSSFGATLPACWFASEQTVGASQHWAITASDGTHGVTAPQAGTNFAYLYVFLASTTYNPYYLTTTTIALPAVPKQLRYFYYLGTGGYHGTTGTTGSDPYPLVVQISTNGGAAWTDLYSHNNTNSVFSTSNAVTNWKQNTISLAAYANQTVLVRFKSMSNFGGGFCDQALDEVVFEDIPPCVDPSALTVTSLAQTTANLSWTASPSNPTGGYQWEVRTSGAPGTPGAVTSGSTAAAVTTALATGLVANTAYTYYVRSDCGSGTFSAWSTGFAFTTLCNAVSTFPFTETFEVASPTRSCWLPTIVSGSVNWTYGAGAGNGGNITTAHGGTVNARHFGSGTGSVARLISPALNFSTMPAQGAQVTFWYANQNWLGDQNQLRVYYKTSAAGAWTLIPGAVYTTNVSAWTEVELPLPASAGPTDYYIAFEGTELFGWGVAVDDVTIAVAPTCPKPTAVTAIGTSPTTAIVSFTPPATGPTVGYIVEYGNPGFVPGTTNTLGGGIGLVLGGSSPIPVPGLTPNTPYDFYVRKICVAGTDFSVNVKATATTLCDATNIPYVQNFESSVVPAPPTCTSVQDLNGNSGSVPNSGGGSWFTYDGGTNTQTFVSPSKTIRYLYDAGNSARPADDWFYTQGLNLTAGTNYRLKFFIKGSDGPTWIESLEVKYGTLAYSSAMTNSLYSNNNIATALASPWDSVVVDFSPAASGVYYIGFHAISLADQAFLYLDDVSVKLAPLVDVGITGVTMPSLNCPTNGVFVQATVTNFNTTTINFATYPVTVTANITGAGTGTLTTLLNTGSLAPGASMSIYLNPSFNFSAAGIYNMTVATSTNPASNDPETSNDSYSTSITVNPNPPVPVITPATPAVCVGTPVQLSTQFTTSPPPTTLPAVTSGTITVPIPDNTPAGISHILNVNTVPVGASITGISVTVNVTHTWIGDVIINLKAPNGNVLNLINQRGGSGDNLSGTTFTSAAGAASLATGAAPFTGNFAPDANAANPPTAFPQNVSSFNGLMSVGNGNWTLALRDNAGLDVGTLTSWSITITYQVLTPTITWTPATGLFTNATATTPYTGGNAYSVYANPAASTAYTATATTAAGCTSSATTTVTVNPYPVVTIGTIPDSVCISDPVIALPATPVGGSWSGIGVSGNTFIPPSTAVGTYTLTYTYTSTAGCTTTGTKKIAVKDCPERMILLRDNALLLYPNPNTGKFNIKVNSVLYNNLVMKVYTNSGVLVRTQQLGGLAWGRIVPIDLTSLPGGVYMVKFYYDGGARTAEKTFKVIIAMD